ncbi:hypothetical protein AAU61_07935 [Desulfocarbo indianensis]|nr:hypothetical protein AAU61_07935 [Desulfocarbo indianensis]
MDNERSLEFLRLIDQAGQDGNMWETGEAMGLEKYQSEDLATELMGRGYLEMVSLNGKVRLTQAGKDHLQGAGSPAGGGGGGLAKLLADLQAAGAAGLSGAAAQDLAADIACLEAQTRRSQPLPPVVQACLKEIGRALAESSLPASRELGRWADALAK